MALKLKKLAVIDEHFASLTDQVYRLWMDKEERQAQTWPAGYKNYMQKNRLRHARILNLLHGGDGNGRSGRSYEYTKLRALPYSAFTAVQHGSQSYLAGDTHPIIIRHQSQDYHLGVYRVFVGVAAIVDGNLNKIHMVPLKAPHATRRFMHHNATGDDDMHPLDFRTNTCWGTFGSTIKPYALDADIPELFRGLQIYLSRYDAGSPLPGSSIDRLGWDTKTPWEEWNAD